MSLLLLALSCLLLLPLLPSFVECFLSYLPLRTTKYKSIRCSGRGDYNSHHSIKCGKGRFSGSVHHARFIRNSLLSFSSSTESAEGLYLERMVERKKIEVNQMLKRHDKPDDPIFMRMAYMASECKYNVTNSLKKAATSSVNENDPHCMSVLVDMKRKSPTVPVNKNIVEFSSAGKFCDLLALSGADAFLINTDEFEYGGTESDLQECSTVAKTSKPDSPPATIVKDIIIHPVQIAKALQQGASGVLLIVAVVGGDLEVLLDACTIMGTEAIVEVHTPNELEFALSRGATMFLVNMWDRATGQLFPDQAKGLANMMPMNAVSIAAGNIHTVEQALELGYYGYDSVVLGRGITVVPDIREFIDGVHNFRGAPRGIGASMKGLPIGM